MGRASLLLLVLLLTGCEGSGRSHVWLDLWVTPDQQGRYLFDQGKYEEAASVFQNPMWKGISYYTAHKWTKAQEQFARVDTVEGNFNLANAYAQDRQIATAIAKYDAVLKRRPTFRAARKNRDYFKEVLAGLTQTDDMEEMGKPPEQPADPSATKFRQDQIQGPDDLAEQNEEKANKQKKSLSKSENERWMKQVATNPGEFLRAKFAIQEQKKATP
jgi:Ca-activated chloride channel family protein